MTVSKSMTAAVAASVSITAVDCPAWVSRTLPPICCNFEPVVAQSGIEIVEDCPMSFRIVEEVSGVRRPLGNGPQYCLVL
ncbi:hypothetical protein [Devosia sp.]|uniref:hypothetical protein n=1 Tax=Devosia sp. TaxID=1871048 RepID=UPI0019E3BDEF|nr:hypothetical protein [Devosia sp.]MBE0581264.1 hypothetical protein [Devosia sp.]